MTADIVLWLDLAEANQMQDASVREHVPPGATILRLTEHGAAQCPAGTPATAAGWRPVLNAIDRMVREARKLERQSPGCRYWVTGRAGLPAFFHLGHRLSMMSAVTFIHQPRNGAAVEVMHLDASSSAATEPPYFERTPWPVPHTESSQPVALVVSSVMLPTAGQIEEALARRQQRSARIVRAHSPARLDKQAVIPAMRELYELIRAICTAHAARSALAVFVAGPSTLAFLVGNAINPRVCRDVQIFEYDGSRYTLAYELPHPPVPERNKVLFFMASPDGLPRLQLNEELRSLRLEGSPDMVTDRITIDGIPAARPNDILHALRTHAPGALHFSGHGETGELILQDDRGAKRPLSMSDLAEALRLAGPSVHLVVLNACHSASHAEALLPHVECVVATLGSIWDIDARRFSIAFYRHLAEGDSVRDAFDKGVLEVRLHRPASAPQAHTRDVEPAGPEPRTHEEPLMLLERDPGCASTLHLVRRR